MTTIPWSELEQQQPALAEAGRRLLYQYGPGLAFLATLRGDGAPRLHPVCPVIVDGGLYVFVGNQSPKRDDLLRDPRYALHTFPPEAIDDEFVVSGDATPVGDQALEAHVLEVYLAQGITTQDHTLFELRADRALHAEYGSRGAWPPTYTRWQAGGRPQTVN
jgi:hypothetical protein